MTSPPSPETLAETERLIEAWLAQEIDSNPMLEAVERENDRSVRRWYVRVRGTEKDVYSIYLTLGQRTLQFETFLMPAPEENHAEFYEHLLRRNHQLRGLHFEIGDEAAVFLAGSIAVTAVSESALDEIVGSVYAAVEQCFRPALRIGFASRFTESN